MRSVPAYHLLGQGRHAGNHPADSRLQRRPRSVLREMSILLRKWRETSPEDRWVYAILFTEIAIAAYLIWSLA